MTSHWPSVVFLLAGIAVCRGQEQFNFVTSPVIDVLEGQAVPLTMIVERTGPTTQSANVIVAAYEGTAQFRLEWRLPFIFKVGDTRIVVKLGALNNEIDEPHRLYIFQLESPSAGYSIGTRPTTIVTYFDDDGMPTFNCNLGDECKNGAQCSSATGICDCSTTAVQTTFEDCGLITSQARMLDCVGVNCGRGGVCATDLAGQTRCICQPGFGGPECTENRKYNVKCHDGGMCVNVQPPSSYYGNRYASEGENYPRCHMSDVTSSDANNDVIPASWVGTYICLDNVDSECGNAVSVNEASGASTIYRQFMIRENFLRTRNDILFTAYCKYDSSGVLYAGPTNVIPGNLFNFVNDSDVISVASVKTINMNTKEEITIDNLVIGEEVCFVVIAAPVYTSLRIKNILASDGRTPVPDAFVILNDGCQAPGMPDVVTRLPFWDTNGDKSTVYFCLSAFSFDKSTTVNLIIQVSACTGSDPRCEPSSCVKGQSAGRRKRDTSALVSKSLRTSLHVYSKRPDNSKNRDTLTGEEDVTCKLSNPIVAAIAVLAIVAALVMVLTVCLILRTTRYNRKYLG